MELKRKYKEEGGKLVQRDWYERNIHPLGLYFHLNNYGEDYVRPLIGLLFIFLISFSFWANFSPYFQTDIMSQTYSVPILTTISTPAVNSTTSTEEMDQNDYAKRIMSAFDKTMSNFFQVNTRSISFDYFIKIAVIIELGVLFIALRRKLERRFRY